MNDKIHFKIPYTFSTLSPSFFFLLHCFLQHKLTSRSFFLLLFFFYKNYLLFNLLTPIAPWKKKEQINQCQKLDLRMQCTKIFILSLSFRDNKRRKKTKVRRVYWAKESQKCTTDFRKERDFFFFSTEWYIFLCWKWRKEKKKMNQEINEPNFFFGLQNSIANIFS